MTQLLSIKSSREPHGPTYYAHTRRTVIDRLREDVASICYPRGRVVGTPGHRRARRVLVGKLEEVGCIPYAGDSVELPYRRLHYDLCNLIGVIPGKNSHLAPLLIGAHYDSAIQAPSADDNAAAVAIALATARHFANQPQPLQRDVIVAIFDAEEQPFFENGGMGSGQFWRHQRDERPIHAALVMDLVGHDVSLHRSMFGKRTGLRKIIDRLPAGLADRDLPLPVLHPLLFMTGAESHPAMADALADAGVAKGLKIVPTLNRYIGDMSDHGVFREHGVPYLFLSCGRWAHYHKKTDTPDRLNYRKMERIARQLQRLCQTLDTTPLPRPKAAVEQICDTLDLEIAHMRSSFGPVLPLLLRRIGLDTLTTREDMDRLVAGILETGV